LTQVQSLSVDRTKLTDAALPRFSALKQLRFLDVRRTAVTQAGVNQLRQLRPDLQINN
jgi:hypothetical protein